MIKSAIERLPLFLFHILLTLFAFFPRPSLFAATFVHSFILRNMMAVVDGISQTARCTHTHTLNHTVEMVEYKIQMWKTKVVENLNAGSRKNWNEEKRFYSAREKRQRGCMLCAKHNGNSCAAKSLSCGPAKQNEMNMARRLKEI